jgi:hypothetical protein
MNDDEARQARTKKIMADAQRLIAQADEALAKGERFFAERGIDRKQLDEYVKRMVGLHGERAVHDQVNRVTLELEARARQLTMTQQASAPSTGRLRRVRNRV